MKKAILLSVACMLSIAVMAQQKTAATKPATKPATAQKPATGNANAQKPATNQNAKTEKLDKIEIACGNTTFKHEAILAFADDSRKYYYRIANDSITFYEHWVSGIGDELQIKKAALKDLDGGDHRIMSGKVLSLAQYIDYFNSGNYKERILTTKQTCNRIGGGTLPKEEKLENSGTMALNFANEEEAKKFLEMLKPMMEAAKNKKDTKK
ncbi:hypothetical protein [Raineya sp.]|jgi:hypothetical protein